MAALLGKALRLTADYITVLVPSQERSPLFFAAVLTINTGFASFQPQSRESLLFTMRDDGTFIPC